MDDRRAAGRPAQYATRAAFLVAGLAMCSLAPIVPVLKARLRLEEHTLGLLLLCVGIGSVMVMPFAGGLAGRFGCRRVILISSLILVATLPFLMGAGNTASLAVALFVFGASGGTLDVTMNVQAVLVEEASKRALMSGFHGLFSVGGLIGASGMTLLMGAGVAPAAAQAAVVALSLVLIAVSTPYQLPFGSREESPPFALPRGRVLLVGALCFVLFMSEGSVGDWSGVFLMERFRLPATQAAYGYVAFASMMTFNRLLGDLIVARLGPQRAIGWGGACATVGFLLTALAPAWPVSLVGFALVGIGLANAVPVLFSAAGRQSDMPANLAVSAVTTMGYAGFLIGPPSIGFIGHRIGLMAAFLVMAALLGLVALSARAVTR